MAPDPLRPLAPHEETAALRWLEDVPLEGEEERRVALLVHAAIDDPYSDDGQRGLAMLEESGFRSYVPHYCTSPDPCDWCIDCRAARIDDMRSRGLIAASDDGWAYE